MVLMTCAAMRCAAFALIGLSVPGLAQRPGVTPPSGPVMAFDVAGVRLGMSAAEARAALASRGYVVAPQQSYSYVESFDQRVRQEADRRLGRSTPTGKWASIHALDATGPHQESVHVDMMQTPAGSIVSHVTFHVPQESMTRDAFKAQVLSKYGNPQRIVAGDEGKWCSPEAAAFCNQALANAGRYDTDFPMLTTSLMGRSLDLSIGSDMSKRVDKVGEAEVEALAPKTAHAAF